MGWDAIGLRAIAASKALPRLRHLELAENGIGDRGAQALLRSSLRAQLEVLALDRNRISGPVMKELKARRSR